MRKSIYIVVLLVGIMSVFVACGKSEGDTANATSSEMLYTSVEELLVNGKYEEAEARIDSAYCSPSLTKKEKSMVYLLRSRLHQLRDEDPYRSTKYLRLHVEAMNDIKHDIVASWLEGSVALLLMLSLVWYYTRQRRKQVQVKSPSDTWMNDWKQAKQSFASTPSGHLILAAISEGEFSNEERKMLLADIDSCFTNIILRMNQEAPHVNREETLYCICSGLHVAPRRMADCLLTTLSTLRSRKARLSNKLPEYMFRTFFEKRESAH